MEKYVYTVKDLQQVLGCGAYTAYGLMRSEGFPSIKLGGRYVVSRKSLEEWLQEQAKKEA